jgi:hypothetical protein
MKKLELGRCPVVTCQAKALLEKHHIIPRSFFVKKRNKEQLRGNKFYIKLCPNCHKILHRIIGNQPHLSETQCFEIVYRFVFNEDINI